MFRFKLFCRVFPLVILLLFFTPLLLGESDASSTDVGNDSMKKANERLEKIERRMASLEKKLDLVIASPKFAVPPTGDIGKFDGVRVFGADPVDQLVFSALKPFQGRLVYVGYVPGVVGKEKTYRLYIEAKSGATIIVDGFAVDGGEDKSLKELVKSDVLDLPKSVWDLRRTRDVE